jgi:undecaprenyl pyrophosphate phosphatase UppP
MSYHLTYLQAVVTGLVQGVTELFPVSSLGHNVLLPALIGGSWAKTLNVSAPGSPYLAFIVGLHVATAIAMIAFFWRDWLRIVRGFVSSLGERRVATPDQRLAWMIILGTIPVGLVGVLVQKEFIKVFAKPELAATFLAINGVILIASEQLRRRKEGQAGGSRAAVAGSRAGGAHAGGGARPAGGPPPGYSQQPRQQQWQGPDPRYGRDDWQRREDWQRQGGGQYGQGGQSGQSGQSGQYGPDGQPIRGSQYGTPQYGQEQYGQEQYGRDPRQEQWRDQARQQDGGPRGSGGQQPGGRHGRPDDGRPAANGIEADPAVAADGRLATIGFGRAVFIGAAQILALLPGISRDGIVTVAGMGRGLTRQDAVRFSFLLSAPVILAAGALKVHDLTGPISKGMHGPIVVGSLIAGVGAYLSIRFLTKYFSEDKSLNPFGIYCIIAGLGSLAYLVLK